MNGFSLFLYTRHVSHLKFAKQFARGDELQKTIRENLKGIGYEF